MDESAKFELELRFKLYELYVNSFIKGIALFLAINGALLKFALDSVRYRSVFSLAAIFSFLVIVIPGVFALFHERVLSRDFARLASATNTSPISTVPLRMLAIATWIFWLCFFLGWIYIYGWLS